MNITHAVNEEVVGDKLKAIFQRQKELMDKYHDIEKRSGLLQTEDCPVNLDDKRGQARIKDFSWRITEELGEALDAINDEEHFLEELIDGLHFLTELTILAGMTPEQIVKYNELSSQDMLAMLTISEGRDVESNNKVTLEERVIILVRELGMMCNCLKNKPWKQTNMITDRNVFYKRLQNVWYAYIGILSMYMTSDEIANVYLKKSQVNKFRQRSGY